ncbi:zinc finger, CCHC-type containing protein [Tanacetum coccineum]
MHSMGKIINELHAMLKLHEQTLPKNNAHALHAIREGKVQKVNNKHKKLQPQLAARGQNQEKGKNKLAYAPKPKIPPLPRRGNPAKDSVCHECGETGHWKMNYPQYLAELLKKKNTASRASGSVLCMRKQQKSLVRLGLNLLLALSLGDTLAKNALRKLKHDGTLNSTDPRAFENVSSVCLERWQENLTHIKWKGPKIYLD